MKAQVVPIGNSKEIQIKHRPRAGWELMFKVMHERGEDRLLIDGCLDRGLGFIPKPRGKAGDAEPRPLSARSRRRR